MAGSAELGRMYRVSRQAREGRSPSFKESIRSSSSSGSNSRTRSRFGKDGAD